MQKAEKESTRKWWGWCQKVRRIDCKQFNFVDSVIYEKSSTLLDFVLCTSRSLPSHLTCMLQTFSQDQDYSMSIVKLSILSNWWLHFPCTFNLCTMNILMCCAFEIYTEVLSHLSSADSLFTWENRRARSASLKYCTEKEFYIQTWSYFLQSY